MLSCGVIRYNKTITQFLLLISAHRLQQSVPVLPHLVGLDPDIFAAQCCLLLVLKAVS